MRRLERLERRDELDARRSMGHTPSLLEALPLRLRGTDAPPLVGERELDAPLPPQQAAPPLPPQQPEGLERRGVRSLSWPMVEESERE
jgi:hypothetical protein